MGNHTAAPTGASYDDSTVIWTNQAVQGTTALQAFFHVTVYGSRNQKELVVKQVNEPGDVAWQGRLIEGSSSNNFEIEEVDTDGDRLSDILEAQIGTDPNLWDTDADNLSDGFEVSFDGISDQYIPGQDLNPFSQDTH